MDIEKIFGTVLDQELRNTLEFVLEDRYAGLKRRQGIGQDQRKMEYDQTVERMARKYYSDDAAECKKFLNGLAECEDKGREDIYLNGIRDGIKFMKFIAMV